MPFPWKKKSRVTRISRIVADLQSPKRGGSLVVQTGFPTSLIDLFVKNRSRFARPKHKPDRPARPEIPDPPPPPPSPASSPPPPIPTFSSPQAQTLGPLVPENADPHADSDRVIEPGSGLGICRGVGVAVRVLVVVILIASVERLTVGVTVSAFALLLLEYAAKRAVSCSRPCVRFQKLLLRLKPKKEEESELANSQGEAEFRSCNSLLLDEIEVVETESEESCCGVIGPELGLDAKWGCSEVVEEVDYDTVVVEASSSSYLEVSECKARKGRSNSFRFKSKMMKKLVPKKFRCSKKEGKMEKMGKEDEAESESEVMEEDKSTSFEIEEETRSVGGKKGEYENRSISKLLLKKGELECIRGAYHDDEFDCGITGSDESSLIGERIVRVGNSGYRVLLVIALAGLVVGRFPALILIMVWCFMLKIVKTLWRSQSHDVPRL